MFRGFHMAPWRAYFDFELRKTTFGNIKTSGAFGDHGFDFDVSCLLHDPFTTSGALGVQIVHLHFAFLLFRIRVTCPSHCWQECWTELMDRVQAKDWQSAWGIQLTSEQVHMVAPLGNKVAGSTLLHLIAFAHDPRAPSWVEGWCEAVVALASIVTLWGIDGGCALLWGQLVHKTRANQCRVLADQGCLAKFLYGPSLVQLFSGHQMVQMCSVHHYGCRVGSNVFGPSERL